MNTDVVCDGYPLFSFSAPRQKSWSEIRKAVRKSHRVASQMINQMPQHFSFCKVGSARRLYFLSIPVGNRENTLLYVDLPDERVSSYEVLEWHDALEPFYQSKFTQLSKEEQLLRERKRQRYVGIASYDYLEFGRKAYFAFAASTCLFVCSDDFSSSHRLMPVMEVLSKSSGKSQIDPKLCPVNPDLLAFVSGGDLWVTHTISGCEERLTFVHKGLSDLASNPKTAGVPSFVVQEEFDRYTGYWWQTSPCPQKDGTGRSTYRILYEEVDESQVDILKVISPASEGASIDEYRYPKAGSKNAVSTLRIVEFTVDENNMICNVMHRHLPQPLFCLFPSMEYLLKAGWIPKEQRIYFELIDRLQQVTQLVVMDVDCFVPTKFNDPATFSDVMDMSEDCDFATDFSNRESPTSWIIYEERSDSWINVSELLYFLPQTLPGTLRFIRGSEKSGFMHLYLVVASMVQPLEHLNHDVRPPSAGSRAKIVKEVQLTYGEWAVDPKEIWVDEKLEFVYFIGYKDTPLETHLYVVSIDSPGQVSRLTKDGFSHSVTMDKACSMFVTVYSSISTPNACEVYSLNWGKGGPAEIPCCLGTILESHKGVELRAPELFSFPSSSGYVLHGMLYKPTTLDPERKHPVLLFVYCGPQVQLVSNSYKAIRFVRLHTLADMGFVVVVIDGRGSCHRGKDFESHIRLRLDFPICVFWSSRLMKSQKQPTGGGVDGGCRIGQRKKMQGTVEIEDQIEGLQWLAGQRSFMDMGRIAVHGWSYGGYITLMALVQHPEIFKVAVAGAPVTSWNLYDTGYTERYMDLPANNPAGYSSGSILKLVDKFPNEEGRLLIVQGLMDENVHFYHTSSLVDALVKACKPHTLQVYPNERHGIRSSEANEHYETMLISFLQRNL